MPPSISGASAPVTLQGVELSLAPLCDRDWDELNNWLRSRLIRIARQSLTKDMDQEERDEVLGAAVREASKVDLMTGRGLREMYGPEGNARMLYQSLRREHPRISPDEAKKLLFTSDGKPDKAAIQEFAQAFTLLNMPDPKKKGDGEGGGDVAEKKSLAEEKSTPGS